MSLLSRVRRRSGFTLLEIMIVVAVIGLLAVIAAPNMLRARKKWQQGACLNGLRIIDEGKTEYAFENPVPVGTGVSWDDIVLYIDLGPPEGPDQCPGGGAYSLNPIGESPTCSLEGDPDFPHSL